MHKQNLLHYGFFYITESYTLQNLLHYKNFIQSDIAYAYYTVILKYEILIIQQKLQIELIHMRIAEEKGKRIIFKKSINLWF